MAKYNGINHLAMATRDMDMTIRYWRDLLGMRLVAGLGDKKFRHYFFEISKTDMIAFFEWQDVQNIPLKDHGVPVNGSFAFDHVAIGVENLSDLTEISKKLSKAGFWVSEIIDHGFIYSIYSFDPNNIPVEFSYNVPDINIRHQPQMKDKYPSEITLEGSEPQPEKWNISKSSTDNRDDVEIYPGEGKIFKDL
ncbi:MAG: VOC family protein [Desulfamplus sp.]|nr:VOC family protein [Desulfamplus sp.]